MASESLAHEDSEPIWARGMIVKYFLFIQLTEGKSLDKIDR